MAPQTFGAQPCETNGVSVPQTVGGVDKQHRETVGGIDMQLHWTGGGRPLSVSVQMVV